MLRWVDGSPEGVSMPITTSTIMKRLLSIATLCVAGSVAACGGSGSSDGSGGAGGTSPGTSHIVFQISNSLSYCKTSSCGSTGGDVGVLDASGKSLRLSAGDCYTPCDTCEMLPCPGAACQEAHGIEVTGAELNWDGHYFEDGTCNGTVACVTRRFAAPGKYTAKMCATPGDVVDAPPSTLKQCVTSGPAECAEVEFDFPSSAPVTAQLP